MSIRDRLFWEEQARQMGIAKGLGIPSFECRVCGVEYAKSPRHLCASCKREDDHD
jgi:hypothetical protein